MKVIYDDLNEFAETIVRCNNTADAGQCSWCPLFDRCEIADIESRRVMIGEVKDNVWTGGGEKPGKEQDG